MNKREKRMAMILNAIFSVCYICFIFFYSVGVFQSDFIEIKPHSGVFTDVLSKVVGFLFQSESGMIPLAIISLSLVIISIFAFSLYKMHFSKVTTTMLCLGFIPALVPILCNTFFGPVTEEKSGDILWLSITIFLIIYFIVFQVLFIKDYKKVK